MSTYAVTSTNGSALSTSASDLVSRATVNGNAASVVAAAAAAVDARETTDTMTTSGTAVKESRMIKLTKREVEVLTLVIEGNSSKEVADHLYVSKRTVDFHLANIYHKLGVTNRVQAFREATRRGLISFSLGNTARQ